MTRPSVSVVVVSHGRPESLLWCLTALKGLRYRNFEVVIVADKSGFQAITETDSASLVKLVRCDEANISAARNLGIKHAAGEIVAFIDDDAAAEPMWLDHLISGFAFEGVACVGGYVRGRNGISFQWTAREVDHEGRARPLKDSGDTPFLPNVRDGFAVKTEGTSMAVKRDVLVALGGFDEAFRFYLDETDLNLRLAQAGHKTALTPLAEVHHAYAASARRGADRAVKTLHEVGASSAVLNTKFNGTKERFEEIRTEQAARLQDQTRRGLLTPEAAKAVLQSLEDGFSQGAQRSVGQYQDDLAPKEGFKPFPPQRGPVKVLSGRWFARTGLRKKARALAASGTQVSLFTFSPTTRFHHMRFHIDGYWEQSGGLFGRANRNEPLFAWHSFEKRLQKEIARVAKQRGIPQ